MRYFFYIGLSIGYATLHLCVSSLNCAIFAFLLFKLETQKTIRRELAINNNYYYERCCIEEGTLLRFYPPIPIVLYEPCDCTLIQRIILLQKYVKFLQ